MESLDPRPFDFDDASREWTANHTQVDPEDYVVEHEPGTTPPDEFEGVNYAS